MFDFNDHYTLNELTAIDNIMCYIRASAAEPIDIVHLRRDLNQLHRSLSRAINSKLDEAALEWDRDHSAAEPAGEAPAAADPPAEDPSGLLDLQALVDDLYRCSARLGALADAEDEHFAECSRTDVSNKVIMLRKYTQAIINAARDIRDHYDGLH